MTDLKFAFRQLLKNKGFITVAVLTLTLGIGANLSIFGILNELLLRPRPVSNPGPTGNKYQSRGGTAP